jgi:membrane protein YqaA with SNARE-associated domain
LLADQAGELLEDTAKNGQGRQVLGPLQFLVGINGLRTRMVGLAQWLLTLGALGVFSISLLDSAFVPLPGGPDAAVIALSAVKPEWMVIYALAATLGSVIGSTLLYVVARKGGIRALKGVRPETREKVEGLLGRYDMLAVMIPAVLPPPFPFKVFILSAGVFKLKLPRFLAAIVVGRATRFLIEGLLAIEFGEEAGALLKHQGPKVLIGVAAMLLMYAGFKYYRTRTRTTPALAVDESGQAGK